jgi:two-component system LytT family response regulator
MNTLQPAAPHPAAVTYLIVDDEAPSRTNLRLAMAAHSGWTLAAECASAAAARTALAVTAADVVFLDIRMPGDSGLALARELAGLDEPPLVVFVTAYGDHAVDAFDVHALDYLLKPLNDARLAQAVERAGALLRHGQRAAYGSALRAFTEDRAGRGAAAPMERISVRSIGRVEQVRVADILWVESAGNYVKLCLAAREVLHRIPLSRLETLLDPAVFLRVHRGALVRREQIGALATVGDGSYRLSLRCGAQLAVSERYVSALRAAFNPCPNAATG